MLTNSLNNKLFVNIEIDGQLKEMPLVQAVEFIQQIATRSPENALGKLKCLIEQEPNELALYHLVFGFFQKLNRFEELKVYAEQALQYYEADATSLFGLAMASRSLRAPVKSIEYLKQAIKAAPNHLQWQKQLAIQLKELGKFEQAIAILNDLLAIEFQPAHCLLLRYQISPQLSEEEVNQLEAISKQTAQQQAVYARLCLFHYYHHQRAFNQALPYLESANRIIRKSQAFDLAKELEEHKACQTVFSSDFLSLKSNNSKQKALGQNRIFICGMPRSGTTLVEQIISSHTAVNAGDELFALPDACQKHINNTVPFPLWAKSLGEQTWLQIGETYEQLTEELSEGKSLTDKMPLNYKAIGIIHLALPKAKVVYCKRNPMDILFGCYKQYFGQGNAFTYQLDELAQMLVAHHKLMLHWQKVLGDKLFVFNYEALIEDQEKVTQELLQYLGLPWQSECLNFHNNPRLVHTLSNVQIRQPLSNQQIGQWQHYSKALSPYLQMFKDEGML